MTELYSLRSTPNAPGNRYTAYEIRKFDGDYTCLATYTVSAGQCSCPRGETGKRCRHQDLLKVLVPKVDTGWFYNKDTRQWHAPLLEPTFTDQGVTSTIEYIGKSPNEILDDLPMVSEGESADRSSASGELSEDPKPPMGTTPSPPSPVKPRYVRR